jgi:hypothetical protein
VHSDDSHLWQNVHDWCERGTVIEAGARNSTGSCTQVRLKNVFNFWGRNLIDRCFQFLG